MVVLGVEAIVVDINHLQEALGQKFGAKIE